MNELVKMARSEHWLTVTSVSYERRDLTLRFELFPVPSDGTPPAWIVTCRSVRQVSLTEFNGGGLNFWKTNHPLLSQSSSPKASLKVTIGGRTRAECRGLMLEAHEQSVNGWIDFERFVPGAASVGAAGGDSFVISGPAFLLEIYRRRLKGAGFAATRKKHRRALYWSGSRWSERRLTVSLLHFGSSFVVAESFAAMPERAEPVRRNRRLQRRGAFAKRRS